MENSCGEGATSESIQRHSGFGIANLVKRLDLLYPGAHGLQRSRTSNQFKVDLWLNKK